jgi:hypothetical protein
MTKYSKPGHRRMSPLTLTLLFFTAVFLMGGGGDNSPDPDPDEIRDMVSPGV